MNTKKFIKQVNKLPNYRCKQLTTDTFVVTNIDDEDFLKVTFFTGLEHGIDFYRGGYKYSMNSRYPEDLAFMKLVHKYLQADT